MPGKHLIYNVIDELFGSFYINNTRLIDTLPEQVLYKIYFDKKKTEKHKIDFFYIIEQVEHELYGTTILSYPIDVKYFMKNNGLLLFFDINMNILYSYSLEN